MGTSRWAELKPVPAIDLPAVDLCDALNSCFEDYVVPFHLSTAQADRRFRRESLDAEASSVWTDDVGPVAVTLIARRGWDSRLAAMAVAKRLRGQGVGRHVMKVVVDEARNRGDRRLVLEVVEQNLPAIKLYEGVGFRKTRRIVGWERPPDMAGAGKGAVVEEADPSVAVRAFYDLGPRDMPWNLQPVTLAQLAVPTKAFTVDGQAFTLVTDTPSDRAVLWQIAVVPESRGQGLARRLVEGVAALYPGKTLFTSIDVPEDLTRGFFERTGFREMSLRQFEMAVDP